MRPLALMLAGCLSCVGPPARAADYTWLGTASTLWTNASNWNPGTGTPGVADTAVFNGAGNGNTTIDLSGTASLLGLVFDTSSAAAYTIGSGGVNAQRLQLANSGTVAMASAVAANQTLDAVLALGTNASAGSYTFQNDSLTNTLTVSGSVLGGSGGTAGVKTLTLAGAGNTTISGVIATGGASSVAVTKSGAGTATLTGANSYTGATTISSGTLQIGNGGTTGSLSTSSAISVASDAALMFNRSDDYGNINGQTFGTVSGAGSIVLQTGTLFVTTNSLTGGIVVNGGQLDIGSTTPMDASGRFTINGGTFTARLTNRTVANAGTITNDFQVGAVGNANALTLSGSFDLAGGTRTVTAVGTGATFSGILYNGALTKSGTSTLVLTNANTYTGTTSVLVGTLQVGANGAAGSISSSSVLVLGGGRLTLNRSDAATQAFASTTLAPGVSTVSANANNTVNFGAITRQPGATLNIAATGTFITSSANTNGILGGGILYNNSAFAVANGASAITGLSTFVNSSTAGNTPANYANANINLDSSQSPTGAITPNSLRTGQGPTLTLANTLNTIQTGGILVVNTNSNPVTITGGTLTGPSGGDIVVTTFKSNVLATTVVSINSVIVDNGGPLGFTIGGTGRVALGGANTYSGTTTINGGILIARNTSAFGTGPVIVRAAATLGTQVTGTIANAIQLNATLTLNPSGSSSTLSGAISGSGLLSIPSGVSGTIAFAGDNTFTGNIQFGTDAAANGPTVLVATRSTSFGLGTKTISLSSVVNSYNRTVALDGSGGDFTLGSTISYTLSNDGSLGSPAVLNIAGNNTIAGAISMTTGGGDTLVQSDAGSLTLAGGITSVSGYRALILGGAAGGTVSGTVADNGANTAGITKQGAGTWTLTAANTYTGTTTINAGTLQIGKAGTAGSLSGLAAITGSSGAALVFSRTNLVSQGTDFGTVIGGGIHLTQLGSGTLALTGSNTYTGTTTAGAGVLRFDTLAAGSGAQPLGAGSVVNLGVAATSAGELDYTGAGGTLDKNVFALGTGRNRIRNSGAGTLTLSGTLTKDGTILELAGGTFNVTGQITGANANSDLYVNGATVTLSNTNNNYNGPTYVYGGGTITLGQSNVIPAGSALLLGGTGSDTGAGTILTGTFTDTVASLTTSALSGTVGITVSGATAGGLTTTGNLTLGGSSDTLALTLSGLNQTRYTLLTYTGLRSGTFDSVTGLGAAPTYTLVYGSGSNGSIDLALKANQTLSLTPAAARVLVGGSTALNGTLVNTQSAGGADLAVSLSSQGTLTAQNFTSSSGATVTAGGTSTVSATLLAGPTVGSQAWSVVNTDSGALTTSATSSGSIDVVNQRTFTTSSSTLALGFVHQGGSLGSPTLVVTSTGLYATTASGTLGGFTGGPGGLALNLTSGSAAFNGGSSPQSATFTLSGSATTPGSLAGTFTSQVSAELGSIANVTVAVTGQVYGGQSTWATNGGGNWGTFSGTDADAFGANWGADQGSPGLDPSFTSTDTATFSSTLTGGTATISLAGANPSLAGITFANAAGSYVLSGGTLALNGGASPATVSITLGSHTIDSAVALVTSASVNVAGGSTLSIGGVIAGSGALTKTGSGTLALGSAETYTGNTTVGAGVLKLDTGASLASSLVTVTLAASLDAADVGGLSLTSGQTLAGEGTIIGGFTVGSGATLAPGMPGEHPGTLFATGTVTWAGGGTYDWRINTIAGGVGTSTGWSFLDGTGALVITSSTASPFNINLTSLSGIDPAVGGAAAGFDPNSNYSFLVAEFDGGISGFSSGAFNVSWGGFSPVNGTFSLQRGDTVSGGTANQLFIVYASVPEPGAFALAAAGLGAWGLGRWRRRRPAQACAT